MTNKSNKPKIDGKIGILKGQYSRLQIPVENDFGKSLSSPILSTIDNVISTTKRNDLVVDEFTGDAKIVKTLGNTGDVIITLNEIKELQSLNPTTSQLLTMLVMTTCAKGNLTEPPELQITLREFMEYRKLKDKKSAGIQIAKDLKTLGKTTIAFKPVANPKKKQYGTPFGLINIVDIGYYVDGKITFKFTSSFYQNVLKVSSIIWLPMSLLRIETSRYPTAYPIGMKFSSHKYMNAGRPNENIISTKALIETSGVKSIEEVKATDRNYMKHIVTPIENGLNCLVDVGTFTEWYYLDANGNRFEDKVMNFSDFQSCKVKVEWKDYPVDSSVYRKRLTKKQPQDDGEPKPKKRKPRKKEPQS